MPRTVAVIGAGAAGLAAVSYLIAEGLNVVVFERRSKPAGVWNAESGKIIREWQDPVYDALRTNVPRTLMSFSDHKWATDVSLFPQHEEVNDYLTHYAIKIQDSDAGKALIDWRYNTEVDELKRSTVNLKWVIETATCQRTGFGAHDDPAKKLWHFDAVVVATGNYNKPFTPADEPGRKMWDAKYPGSLQYAHEFKNASPFKDKVVVVVGNGPSGWDISSQLAGVAKQVIMSLSRQDQPVSSKLHRKVGKIVGYHPASRGIEFENRVRIKNVDHIIYCTGYVFSFPFFQKGKEGTPVIPASKKIENLYKHIFYVPEPSLAFIGLPKMAASFTIAEAQSAYVARAFSDRLLMPVKAAMQADVHQQELACQIGGANDMMSCMTYHTLAPSKDKEYINELAKLSLQAQPFPNGNVGKAPPFWCKCFDSARASSRRLRDEHKARVDDGNTYSTYESLGCQLDAPCRKTSSRWYPKGSSFCYIP